MSRTTVAGVLASLTLFGATPAQAESVELRELKELRQIVEQQTKQIEALTQQVSKLAQASDGQRAAAPTTAGALPPEAPAPPPAPEIPRAEAVNPGVKHVVVKGETLTSIAKQYNITIPELQKVNRIENDRKLQIGQTLTIPAPKTSEPASEKKENP